MRNEILKKIDEVKEILTEHLKEPVRFVDVFKEDSDPKKVLANLLSVLGKLTLITATSEMKEIEFPKNKAIENPVLGKCGLVKVRPCGDEKTYLGFLIGEVALGSSLTLTDDNKLQLNFAHHNPAIYVPELGKLIYGMESWWGNIESEKDLQGITDSDIDNVWYVKLLKAQLGKDEK